MYKSIILLIFLFTFNEINAQLVEVQANYNSVGDVDFVAHNNSKSPLFLNIDFADLENTTFNEPLPYIKLLEPGFNALFTLHRYPNADVPRFNYQIKYFRSNPMADVNLDFPYLIPFAPGSKVFSHEVKSITGFWGADEPKSWNATGFKATQGTPVYACRQGIVADIVGSNRSDDPQTWYHTWNNSITLLLPDGTLMCYRNVIDKNRKLKIGQKIYAGQILGEIAPLASELVLLVFQNSINQENLIFIIPHFVVDVDNLELIISAKEYLVVHPDEIRGMEMSAKEKRKNLN